MTSQQPSYTVLSGGVGGAKLVLGLRDILPTGSLQVVANTGDDFEHFGLPISPDIDTLIYTLSGQANTDTGWGLAGETQDFMDAVGALGGPNWFFLGDKDLQTHAQRRALLVAGLSLSEATHELCRAAGVHTAIWPMTDFSVRTKIKTASQIYDFQDYFVRLKAEPVATGFTYAGAGEARASTGALQALQADNLAAIIITPSNPWLSIDPIMSLSDIYSLIEDSTVPVVAISPIVGGQAIKGPTAKLMRELGLNVSCTGIAQHYQTLIDGLIIDQQDADQMPAIEALGIKAAITDTVMNNLNDKTRLAEFTLNFAAQLSAGAGQ